jgi:hypothetical protein
VSTLPTMFQHSTGIPSQNKNTRERNKRNSNNAGRSYLEFIFTLCGLKPERP